ncbi:MAG: tetratricopeptide repeat protein [Sphingobacteriales bacterium]
MFTNKIRLFIGTIFLLSLTILVNLRLYEFASVALMFIILLAWDYFRSGTLVVAARYFHHKEYDRAERALQEIFKPEWLRKNRRGYYEYLMGGICLQKQEFEDAGKHYEIAAQYPLRSVNDHVAALVHVANISIRQGNYNKAEAYLQLTEKHQEKINAKMKDVISRLHEEIKKHKK